MLIEPNFLYYVINCTFVKYVIRRKHRISDIPMKAQDIFIAQPESREQVEALKAFMKALKIKFEVSSDENYNPEFVEKLLKSRKQAREGKVTRVKKEELKEFLDLEVNFTLVQFEDNLYNCRTAGIYP